MTPSETAKSAVENDPVRNWLDSAEHVWSLEFYRDLMLAPNLETFLALRRGEPVPIERLDGKQVVRFGLRPRLNDA